MPTMLCHVPVERRPLYAHVISNSGLCFPREIMHSNIPCLTSKSTLPTTTPQVTPSAQGQSYPFSCMSEVISHHRPLRHFKTVHTLPSESRSQARITKPFSRVHCQAIQTFQKEPVFTAYPLPEQLNPNSLSCIYTPFTHHVYVRHTHHLQASRTYQRPKHQTDRHHILRNPRAIPTHRQADQPAETLLSNQNEQGGRS